MNEAMTGNELGGELEKLRQADKVWLPRLGRHYSESAKALDSTRDSSLMNYK